MIFYDSDPIMKMDKILMEDILQGIRVIITRDNNAIFTQKFGKPHGIAVRPVKLAIYSKINHMHHP